MSSADGWCDPANRADAVDFIVVGAPFLAASWSASRESWTKAEGEE